MDRLIRLHSAYIVKIDNGKQLKSLRQTVKDELGINSFYISAGLIVPFQPNFMSPIKEAQKKRLRKF